MKFRIAQKDAYAYAVCVFIFSIIYYIVSIIIAAAREYTVNPAYLAGMYIGSIWMCAFFLFIPLFIISLIKSIIHRHDHEYVMSKKQCIEAVKKTIIAVPSLRASLDGVLQNKISPEMWLNTAGNAMLLKEDILKITRAEFSDDEVRYYFPLMVQKYLRAKGNS